tara:strand:- start:2027 stop:2263 length:237 start_codon:yes stop_codon:yes gene_type:complete
LVRPLVKKIAEYLRKEERFGLILYSDGKRYLIQSLKNRFPPAVSNSISYENKSQIFNVILLVVYLENNLRQYNEGNYF